MLYFTRVLHVEGRGYSQFTFKCVLSPKKKKYHVTVLTSSPQCFHFVMEPENGTWKITEAPRPPEWIMAMEARLSQAIIYRTLLQEAARGHLKTDPVKLYNSMQGFRVSKTA